MVMIHPRGERQQMPIINTRVDTKIEAAIDAMISR